MYKLAQEIADGLTHPEMQSLQLVKWGAQRLTIQQQKPLISLRLLEKQSEGGFVEPTPLGTYVLGLVALEDRKAQVHETAPNDQAWKLEA